MGINHGGPDVTVSQQLLNRPNIITIKVTRNWPVADDLRNYGEKYGGLPVLKALP